LIAQRSLQGGSLQLCSIGFCPLFIKQSLAQILFCARMIPSQLRNYYYYYRRFGFISNWRLEFGRCKSRRVFLIHRGAAVSSFGASWQKLKEAGMKNFLPLTQWRRQRCGIAFVIKL